MAIDKTEIWKPYTWFIQCAGFTAEDIKTVVCHYRISKSKDGYLPVAAILMHINEDRKVRSRRRNFNLAQLEEVKKQEEITKLQLYNGEKNGTLIQRAYAKERVRLVFQNVVSKVRYSIKNISPRLVGMDNARTVEEVISKAWNGAITLLEQESKCLDWENDHPKVKLSDTKPLTYFDKTKREIDETFSSVNSPRMSDFELEDR